MSKQPSSLAARLAAKKASESSSASPASAAAIAASASQAKVEEMLEKERKDQEYAEHQRKIRERLAEAKARHQKARDEKLLAQGIVPDERGKEKNYDLIKFMFPEIKRMLDVDLKNAGRSSMETVYAVLNRYLEKYEMVKSRYTFLTKLESRFYETKQKMDEVSIELKKKREENLKKYQAFINEINDEGKALIDAFFQLSVNRVPISPDASKKDIMEAAKVFKKDADSEDNKSIDELISDKLQPLTEEEAEVVDKFREKTNLAILDELAEVELKYSDKKQRTDSKFNAQIEDLKKELMVLSKEYDSDERIRNNFNDLFNDLARVVEKATKGSEFVQINPEIIARWRVEERKKEIEHLTLSERPVKEEVSFDEYIARIKRQNEIEKAGKKAAKELEQNIAQDDPEHRKEAPARSSGNKDDDGGDVEIEDYGNPEDVVVDVDLEMAEDELPHDHELDEHNELIDSEDDEEPEDKDKMEIESDSEEEEVDVSIKRGKKRSVASDKPAIKKPRVEELLVLKFKEARDRYLNVDENVLEGMPVLSSLSAGLNLMIQGEICKIRAEYRKISDLYNSLEKSVTLPFLSLFYKDLEPRMMEMLKRIYTGITITPLTNFWSVIQPTDEQRFIIHEYMKTHNTLDVLQALQLEKPQVLLTTRKRIGNLYSSLSKNGTESITIEMLKNPNEVQQAMIEAFLASYYEIYQDMIPELMVYLSFCLELTLEDLFEKDVLKHMSVEQFVLCKRWMDTHPKEKKDMAQGITDAMAELEGFDDESSYSHEPSATFARVTFIRYTKMTPVDHIVLGIPVLRPENARLRANYDERLISLHAMKTELIAEIMSVPVNLENKVYYGNYYDTKFETMEEQLPMFLRVLMVRYIPSLLVVRRSYLLKALFSQVNPEQYIFLKYYMGKPELANDFRYQINLFHSSLDWVDRVEKKLLPLSKLESVVHSFCHNGSEEENRQLADDLLDMIFRILDQLMVPRVNQLLLETSTVAVDVWEKNYREMIPEELSDQFPRCEFIFINRTRDRFRAYFNLDVPFYGNIADFKAIVLVLEKIDKADSQKRLIPISSSELKKNVMEILEPFSSQVNLPFVYDTVCMVRDKYVLSYISNKIDRFHKSYVWVLPRDKTQITNIINRIKDDIQLFHSPELFEREELKEPFEAFMKHIQTLMQLMKESDDDRKKALELKLASQNFNKLHELILGEIGKEIDTIDDLKSIFMTVKSLFESSEAITQRIPDNEMASFLNDILSDYHVMVTEPEDHPFAEKGVAKLIQYEIYFQLTTTSKNSLEQFMSDELRSYMKDDIKANFNVNKMWKKHLVETASRQEELNSRPVYDRVPHTLEQLKESRDKLLSKPITKMPQEEQINIILYLYENIYQEVVFRLNEDINEKREKVRRMLQDLQSLESERELLNLEKHNLTVNPVTQVEEERKEFKFMYVTPYVNMYFDMIKNIPKEFLFSSYPQIADRMKRNNMVLPEYREIHDSLRKHIPYRITSDLPKYAYFQKVQRPHAVPLIIMDESMIARSFRIAIVNPQTIMQILRNKVIQSEYINSSEIVEFEDSKRLIIRPSVLFFNRMIESLPLVQEKSILMDNVRYELAYYDKGKPLRAFTETDYHSLVNLCETQIVKRAIGESIYVRPSAKSNLVMLPNFLSVEQLQKQYDDLQEVKLKQMLPVHVERRRIQLTTDIQALTDMWYKPSFELLKLIYKTINKQNKESQFVINGIVYEVGHVGRDGLIRQVSIEYLTEALDEYFNHKIQHVADRLETIAIPQVDEPMNIEMTGRKKESQACHVCRKMITYPPYRKTLLMEGKDKLVWLCGKDCSEEFST